MEIKTKSTYSFTSADGVEHDNAYDCFLDDIEPLGKSEIEWADMFCKLTEKLPYNLINGLDVDYDILLCKITKPDDFLPIIAVCDPCETEGLRNLVNDTMNNNAATGIFTPQAFIIVHDVYGAYDVYNADEVMDILIKVKTATNSIEQVLNIFYNKK